MYGDPKVLERIKPRLQRVLVVETYPPAAKLLLDLLKGFGAEALATAVSADRAMDLAQDFDPQLLLIEFSGAGFDGAAFTRELRRSRLSCRQAPVIMIGAEPTAEDIRAARDSGAHEFLLKPYTTKDLFRRVENVALRPRPWIEAKMYVGPDRRRFNSAEYRGARKRGTDAGDLAMQTAVQAAASNIRSCLGRFAFQPHAALGGMLNGVRDLQTSLSRPQDEALSAVAAALERYLQAAIQSARLSPRAVERHLEALHTLAFNETLSSDSRRRLVLELERAAA